MTKESQVVGTYPVKEVLKSEREISKVLIQKDLKSSDIQEIIQACKDDSIPVQFVPKIRLDKVSKINHQGVLAYISPIQFYDLDSVCEELSLNNTTSTFLMLDGITDTRNFGAICRTAECMGVSTIIIPRNGSAPINEGTLKSSAGAIFKLKICRVNHLLDAIYILKEYGVTIVSCTEKATDSLSSYSFEKNSHALLFGSEDRGINPKLIDQSDNHLKIDMYGSIESLNVGVSVGMFLYELTKTIGK